MNTRHHNQTVKVLAAFVKDIHSLLDVIDELGNPFEEEGDELIAFHTTEFAGTLAVKNVRKVVMSGKEQFQIYITKRLVDITKSIYDVINSNKFKIFESSSPKTAGKGKQQIASLKKWHRTLLVAVYTLPDDGGKPWPVLFFRHENHCYPSSISDDESLHQRAKSDLLACLEGVFEAK